MEEVELEAKEEEVREEEVKEEEVREDKVKEEEVKVVEDRKESWENDNVVCFEPFWPGFGVSKLAA